jgi:predicted site-specific integrase-resolvase
MYRIGEFAEKIGRSIQTLRRWDETGELVAHKSPKGHRYYTEDQYLKFIGKSKADSRYSVAYVRVSSPGQKDGLDSQKNYISDYCRGAGIAIDDWVEDIGSGLNYNRKGFNKLIDSVLSGKISRVIIAHPDRLVRFGFEWFRRLLEKYGCEVHIINDERLSPQEEMVQDLISIIHVFSCRIYGLRKYKKEIRKEL